MSEADRGSRRVTGWRKRLRVVLVLAVILVILNGYALFMKGDIKISEQLLDQLSTVEGETLKANMAAAILVYIIEMRRLGNFAG